MNVVETRHNITLFALAFISFFMTQASLHYTQHLQALVISPLPAQMWLILQWFVMLSIVLNASSRPTITRLLRALRARPLWLWLIIALATPPILLIFESIRNDTHIIRDYLAWNLAWLGFMVFFAEPEQGEYRRMAHRIGTSRLSGWLISLTTLVILLIGAELSLRTWLVFSNGYATGSIHTEWLYRYWQPLNELQFRDKDIYRPLPPDTQRILFLGDSFTAGIGVNHIEETFPHLLGQALGDDYAVHVVAHAGWNTDQQAYGLATYPIQPDILVYAYFLNDASYINSDVHASFLDAFPPPSGILFDIVNYSRVADFLYWNVYTQYLRRGNADYARMMADIYNDEAQWRIHQEDIRLIVDWTRNVAQADMVMLLWPLLNDIEASRPVHARIKAYMQELGVPVVDMIDHLADVPLLQRVANPFDMHPGTWSHQLAAQALYEGLRDEGFITP